MKPPCNGVLATADFLFRTVKVTSIDQAQDDGNFGRLRPLTVQERAPVEVLERLS